MRAVPVLEPSAASADPRVGAQPFLKWAGGKWAVAPQIKARLPKDAPTRVYREPFLGGGAMFFYLEPERAILSDAVTDLIATYRIVQTRVEPLIRKLEGLRSTHSVDQFYEIRRRFNEERKSPEIDRAAWLIYLNKTCYNGLFRTNKSGEFNVPAGRFKNPGVVDPERLRLASAMLSRAELVRAPFTHLLEVASPGDLIYLDPPYIPTSRTSSFSSYSDGAFTLEDHERLAKVYRELDARGCLLALSNSDTPDVRRLYEGFDFSPIIASRAISAKAETRGDVSELLIRNVKRYP